VSTFTSHVLVVKNMQTSGNSAEVDIISGVVARYCSLDIDGAICKNQEHDERKCKDEKRQEKLAN